MDLILKKVTDTEGYIHHKEWDYPIEVVNGELKSISVFWDKTYERTLYWHIPELTQDELAEYCKGICRAEEFLLKHLKSRFDTMKEGEEQMFTQVSFFGLAFPKNGDFTIEEIMKLLGYQFDSERDIVFLFNWFDSDAVEGKIVYTIPERIIKERRDKVKVWQPGDEEPTIYADIEEVN